MTNLENQAPQLLIIGDICVDLILGELNQWPERGTETLLDSHELRPGGAAANTALAVYYLGGKAKLLTAVGQDFFGLWLQQQMQALTTTVPSLNAATTVTIGLVHADSERTFLTTQGHLNQITYDTVLQQLPRRAIAGSVVLLSGVFLTPRLRQNYLGLIRHLQQQGYQVAIDTNWPAEGWSEALRQEVLEWLRLCDHVLLNDLEVRHLAAQESLQAALASLQSELKTGASLVIKHGAQGAIGVQHGQQISVPARPVKVSDTIGAGDSFNAGYLLARINGANLQQALDCGCQTASAIVGRTKRNQIQAGEFADLLPSQFPDQEVA